MNKQNYTGLQKALSTVGGVPQLASAIGVTQKVLRSWLREDGVPEPDYRPTATGIQKVVELAGGPTALARAVGVSFPAVQFWVKQGYAPLERAKELELQFGVPRTELVSAKVRNAMGLGGEL